LLFMHFLSIINDFMHLFTLLTRAKARGRAFPNPFSREKKR